MPMTRCMATMITGAVMLALCTAGLRPALAQVEEGDEAKPVATIDGVAISERQVEDAAVGELEELELKRMQSEADYKRSRHQIMEAALKRLVEEHLLDAEAERLGTTRQELLAREVEGKVTDPGDEEVDQFYERNRERIRGTKEQVSGQIRRYLRQQDYNRVKEEYLDRLEEGRKISMSLGPLRYEVAVDGHPARGRTQAPVTIVEFSDFQCPYCRDFSLTLARILEEFPSEVRLVFRQLPLREIHPQAEKAAEASLCAEEQGKFWELHDLMFEDQSGLRIEQLKAKAAGLGLEAGAFNACLDSGKQAERVRQDIRESARLGASGTPAVFINGRFLSGSRPFEELASIIREELDR